MSKEICISSTPHETRLAILEDDQLTEVYYERENEYTLAGSIYKGRVTRVLPGMQSAFVDLGLERDAFLYVTDFMEEQEDSSDFERIPANGRNDEGREPQARENRQPRAASGEEEAPRRTAYRQVRHPAKGRQANLRMEPGAGVAVAAAARAFALHSRVGSRQSPSPRTDKPDSPDDACSHRRSPRNDASSFEPAAAMESGHAAPGCVLPSR